MEITYVPTGQKITFRGADDPLKFKGVKFPTGYAAVVWLEELDQFDGTEAVGSILNSLRRGGDDFWCFYSYKPARKGRMRKFSYEWLAGLREIVIYPVRCPFTFEEFAMKEHERDRDGSWLDIIPDGDDHSIDAVRYALMDDVLRE